MPETSLPFNGTDYYEDDWHQLARAYASSSVENGNKQSLAGSVAGPLQTRMGTGKANVRGFAYINSVDPIVYTHDAVATGGQKRIDTVVIRLDKANHRVVSALLAGTPGATPSRPALTTNDDDTGIWEMPVYDAVVTAGSTVVQVVDRRLLRTTWQDARASLRSYRRDDRSNEYDLWTASTMGTMAGDSAPCPPGEYLVTFAATMVTDDGTPASGNLRVLAQSNSKVAVNMTLDMPNNTDGVARVTSWMGTFTHEGGLLTIAAYQQYAGKRGRVYNDGANIAATLIRPL